MSEWAVYTMFPSRSTDLSSVKVRIGHVVRDNTNISFVLVRDRRLWIKYYIHLEFIPTC